MFNLNQLTSKNAKQFLKKQFSFKKNIIAVIPFLIIAILFIVVPLILLISQATKTSPGLNKAAISSDPYLWEVIGSSIYQGLLVAVIALVIVFPFVYIVVRSSNRTFKFVFLFLIISPLFVFTIAKVFALKGLLLAIFDDESYNNLFVKLIGMVYLYSPFMVLPLYSVLNQLPKSLLEASYDLGNNKFRTFFKVVVPYALKAIFAGLALIFMLAATNLVISNNLLIGGQSAPKYIGNIIDYQAERMSSSNIAKITGSTISLITIAIMISIYALIVYAPTLTVKIKGVFHGKNK